jgi:hypothetical protein
MRLSPEHKGGVAIVCVLGAVCGLFGGFIFFSVAQGFTRRFGTGAVFLFWIQRPELYWPWPAFGAAIAGLGFYSIRILRLPGEPLIEADAAAPPAPSSNSYYQLLAKAISRLPINDRASREKLYDLARATLADCASQSELMRERRALDAAIRKLERRAPRYDATNPLHRPTTASLVFSMFFPQFWLIDITCMSVYWVARLPNR